MKEPNIEWLTKAISDEIEARTSAMIDQEMKDVSARVERHIRSQVGQIAATVVQRMSFEYRGVELIIRVDFKNTQT